jgi:hypothetical protein
MAETDLQTPAKKQKIYNPPQVENTKIEKIKTTTEVFSSIFLF